MPEIFEDDDDQSSLTELPFPPITKAHILNCSYNSWHPRYRTITPKSRLIPLTRPFLDYIRADGIVLPSEEEEQPHWDSDSGIYSASDDPDAGQGDDDVDEDVAADWRDTHSSIKSVIADLGGKVVPKLNWSAPKDATWINANSLACASADDIYLLLKSSDFITHDLEHAFDDSIDTPQCSLQQHDIPYYLVLRKYFQMNPSMEFRCFVRRGRLLCICQRDLNHFDFLFKMQDKLRSVIQEFFDVRLRDTFPDENFAFDVYLTAEARRVWLVDVNPWAPRTDPLLFSWMEILTMPEPPRIERDDVGEEEFVRLSIRPATETHHMHGGVSSGLHDAVDEDDGNDDSGDDTSVDEELWLPELRLVRKSDPEAYSFNTPQYSAHKLPRDVVDASQSGAGLREFAHDWREELAKWERKEVDVESSEEE